MTATALAQSGDVGRWDAAFEAARAAAPALYREQRFRVAGSTLQIETVGHRIHEFVAAALRHLADQGAKRYPNTLRVRLWDADDTGVSSPLGSPSGDPDHPETIALSDDGRVVTDHRGQWIAVLDRSVPAVWGCAAMRAPRPLLHDYGKPLQTLLAVWCHDLGAPPVHAGMVALGDRGVLLGGTGGSGKSTTALACLEAGFTFLGDDRIVLQQDGNRFVGHSLFNSVLIDAGQLQHFPRLAHHAIAAAHARERKPLAFLADVYSRQTRASATVCAVALLRVARAGRTGVRPARTAEALLHIAPSSLILPLGPGARGMARMAELLRAVPSYWVDLGTDLSDVAAAVASLLEGRASRE
jgi:hypothetical protein